MSLVSITQALETALNSITPVIETAWENVDFTPTTGVEYQMVSIISESENPTQGSDFYREVGFMQVDLMYPVGHGSLPSKQRFELIRDTFFRGASFEKDSVTVHISKTPEMPHTINEDDRYRSVVRVEFFANVC